MVSDEILLELKKVNSNLSKQISFKRGFLLSMIQGIGTAVGATLIAGIVIALLYQFIISIDTLPLIQKLFPQPTLQQLLNSTFKK